LITGGHVYGRCHPEHSGYAGAWVENPTYFSNEYAADMFEDKWMLVGHDSKLPDGRPVPEEIRPAKGKRQYINMSKLEDDDDGEKENLKAPDCNNFPPGVYTCVSQWVNCREEPSTTSPIIGRFVEDTTINLVAVKVFGTAIRGRAERGGWVSIIASGGKTLFERKGDLDTQMMTGQYRRLAKLPYYQKPEASEGSESRYETGVPLVEVTEVKLGTDGGVSGAVFGKVGNLWGLLYSPSRGMLAEKIVEGYNEKIRKPIKGQDGNQMMLISDMVMLWDPSFREVLREYADDDKILMRDFGVAFKRLTELGCPWGSDPSAGKGGCPASMLN
jgi:hypothetical protein